MRQGWEYKKLGDSCVIEYGTRVVQKKDGGTIYPVYGGGGETFRMDKYNRENCLVVARFAMSRTCVRYVTGKFFLNDSGLSINAGKELLQSYLNHHILYLNDDIYNLGKGAAQRNLDVKSLRNLIIAIPPLSTQLSIVSELDKINELIRLKKEQLKDYDNLAQSIFYEMFGDPVVNEKGWEVKKLGEVCECITDGDHMPPPKSDTGIPFVTIGNVNKASRQIDFDNTYFVPRDYFDNIPNIKKPRRGDVLYTVTGSYGIPIIINYDKEFCFQRHIGLLRPKDFMSPVFLCMWALNDRTKGQADMVATGIAQKTVSLKSLRNFAIILPPLPLQQLFAQRIELIEQQKAEIQSTIADLETLLASRMQYWFD